LKDACAVDAPASARSNSCAASCSCVASLIAPSLFSPFGGMGARQSELAHADPDLD
jgi:hypothetical protein